MRSRRMSIGSTRLRAPTDAENLMVTDAQGNVLDYVVNDRSEFAQFLEIDFRRNIFFRQTATVVVSFMLPEGVPPRPGPSSQRPPS